MEYKINQKKVEDLGTVLSISAVGKIPTGDKDENGEAILKDDPKELKFVITTNGNELGLYELVETESGLGLGKIVRGIH
jgi:hypothetical protein